MSRFSVVDVVGLLSKSSDAGACWSKPKQRLVTEGSEVVTKCHSLKLITPDGLVQEADCANVEGIFRIIQSMPFPKADPFKLWLLKLAQEGIAEIENPELGIQRARELYEKKRYPREWISKRIKVSQFAKT